MAHEILWIFSPNPDPSAANHKKTVWIAWKKPQGGFVKINFDGSKALKGQQEYLSFAIQKTNSYGQQNSTEEQHQF